MTSTLRLAVLSCLLLTLLVAPAGPVPASLAAPAAGGVSGVIFFDADGNGVQGSVVTEPAQAGVTVTVTGGAFTGMAITDAAGIYTVIVPDAAVYTVTETLRAGYASTTGNVRSVPVSSTVVTGINFGDAIPLTLTGWVFADEDGDGVQAPFGEPGIADALVEIFADLNANGRVDSGEPLRGSAVSASDGVYIIRNLLPGLRVVRVQPPGGSSGSSQTPLPLISCEVCGTARELNIPVPPTTGASATLYGQLWNDADGDETIDSDEPFLPGVRLTLYTDSGGGQPGAIVGPAIVTDAGGNYRWEGAPAGAYVLVVDDLSLPAAWTPSFADTDLMFSLAEDQIKQLNLGYYDPLMVAPLRVSEWKKELKQSGKPHYTPTEMVTFTLAAETASRVFSETVGLAYALTTSASTPEEKARKQWAAVRLNLASARLLTKTPVNLPELTTKKTVGEVISEIEALLYPPASQTKSQYERAEKIADSLNNGKGLGYGLQGKTSLAKGVYGSSDVTSALKSSGGVLDTYMDYPIVLSKWSAGSLDPTLNVFRPQLRLFIQIFYNGGTLEVMQKLSNGAIVSLGTVTPAYWNKDIKTYYTFDLWRVASVGELASLELRVYVRDPDNDTGVEHVKIDLAELSFSY
jgi:hypothetical protein